MTIENDGVTPETVTPTATVVETDAPVAEQEESTTSPDEQSAKPKKSHWATTRINELVRDREESRRERDHWRELALQKQGITKEQDRKEVSEGKPEPSKYESYEAYLDALTDWKVENRLKTERDNYDKQNREKREQDRQAQALSGFDKKLDKVREKFEDFDDVAFGRFPVTQAMTEALLESDIGPEILYHLGSNPQEAMRIARLSPYAQAREIGKLEAKLPELTKPTSSAPAPINPVKPKSAATEGPSDSDDTEQWIKKRQKQVHGK